MEWFWGYPLDPATGKPSQKDGIFVYFIVNAAITVAITVGLIITYQAAGVCPGLALGAMSFLFFSILWGVIKKIGPDTLFEAKRDLINVIIFAGYFLFAATLVLGGAIVGATSAAAALENSGGRGFVLRLINYLASWSISLGYPVDSQTTGLIVFVICMVAMVIGGALLVPLDYRHQGIARTWFTSLFDLLDRWNGNPRQEWNVVMGPDPANPGGPQIVISRTRIERDDLHPTKFWDYTIAKVVFAIASGALILVGWLAVPAFAARYGYLPMIAVALVMTIVGLLLMQFLIVVRSFYKHNPHLEGSHGHPKHPHDAFFYDPDAAEKRRDLWVHKNIGLPLVVLLTLLLVADLMVIGAARAWDAHDLARRNGDSEFCVAARQAVYRGSRMVDDVYTDRADVDGTTESIPMPAGCKTDVLLRTDACRDLLTKCDARWKARYPDEDDRYNAYVDLINSGWGAKASP